MTTSSIDPYGFLPHICIFRWLHSDNWDESKCFIDCLVHIFVPGWVQLPSNPWADGDSLLLDKNLLPQVVPKFRSLLKRGNIIDGELSNIIQFMSTLDRVPSYGPFLEADPLLSVDNSSLSLVLRACRRQLCLTQEAWELDGLTNSVDVRSSTYWVMCFSLTFML